MKESEINRSVLRGLRALPSRKPATPRPRAATERLELAPGQSPAELLEQELKKRRRGRNKFNAVRTDGYASKAEARFAASLCNQRRLGVIADWLEQVPIKLSEGITYRVDFMILERDGSVRFVEVKGHETPEWKLKYKLLCAERPEIAKRLSVVSV